MNKGTNDYCPHCEEFNTVLDSVCCKCGNNIHKGRPATIEEKEEVVSKLDDAIDQFKKILE